MSDYTTKATVELDVNGQKAKQELEQQRKLVKDLEILHIFRNFFMGCKGRSHRAVGGLQTEIREKTSYN